MTDKIAHYEITDKLGEGGMGVVYQARDTHLDRFVAIKVLPPAKVANPERKRRFVQEAKSASALNHPNIITVHDIDQQDGIDFIVMEYVPGKTLEKLIPRQGMGLNEVLNYSVQIAAALSKAHAAGIVHRDLKPGNIMVSEDGLVKVLDFGLAKLTEMELPGEDEATQTLRADGGPHTEEGAILGTVSYMSPEQAEGRKVDARSDIFALGLVLYEMVTGQRAFQCDSKMSTLAAIIKEEPKAVREVAEGIPSELERIINRCLRKDPNRRFMQIGEVKLALEDLKEESDSGKLAPATGRSAPQTSLARRPNPAIAVAVVLALAVAVAGTYLFVANESPLPGSNLTIRPLTSFEGEEQHPTWNPDGSLMAYAHVAHGSADIFVIPAGGGTPVRLTDHPADDLMPSWSPDGRHIAFLSDRGTGSDVYLIPRPIGVERKLTETYLPRDLALTNGLGAQPWSPDGRELLFPRLQADGGVAVWKINLATSDETQVTFPPPRGWSWDASWSFDSEWIAFEGRRDGKTGVWVMPAVGGDPHLLSEGGKWPVWSPDSRRVVFSSDRGSAGDLWEVDIDSGQLQQLTSGPGEDRQSVVAANGALAYGHFSHQLDLYSMQLETGEEERLTSHIGTNINARVSPNGKTIAYHSERTANPEVWLLDLEKKTEQQLTDDPAEDGHPDWSPDGREIVFLSNRDGERHLWVVGANGGPSRRLTRRSIPSSLRGRLRSWNIAPRWSPDGAAVGYLAPAKGGTALWVVDREGIAIQKRLSGVPFSFDWYLDSRHVIFTGMAVDESGTREMRAANLDTGEETTLYRGLHTELAVAPDGRGVTFCHSVSHFNQNLFLLRLTPPTSEGGLPRPLGEARQLTDGKGIWHVHNGGWSPDGKSVVYTKDTDQGDIHVIENYR